MTSAINSAICLSSGRRRLKRRVATRGDELIEFTITLLPLLCILSALISVSWGIFAKSVLQYAVKVAVRDGITVDAVAAGSSNLTTIVKNLVQQNSFGFLKDTTLIHVHYYQPPSPGSTGPVTDVSTVTTGPRPGNYPGNIMVVSVDGYSLPVLMVRIFNWNSEDKSSTSITVSSADLIEPIDPSDLAPLGTAP